jgi:hypothetical protein
MSIIGYKSTYHVFLEDYRGKQNELTLNATNINYIDEKKPVATAVLSTTVRAKARYVTIRVLCSFALITPTPPSTILHFTLSFSSHIFSFLHSSQSHFPYREARKEARRLTASGLSSGISAEGTAPSYLIPLLHFVSTAFHISHPLSLSLSSFSLPSDSS